MHDLVQTHIRDGWRRSARLRRVKLVRAGGVGLSLTLSGAGFAAAGSTVVPPNGKVAGHGYAYYEKRGWQLFFSFPGPEPKACRTITVDGQVVAIVGGFRDKSSCVEPAGRPIYFPGPVNECSTVKGDHGSFSTSASALKKCARFVMRGAVASESLDGHVVANFARFLTATGVFKVHVPKNRFPGITSRTPRSAAYGYGLLVTGLTKGTHTLKRTGTIMGVTAKATVTVQVY
jgi:hypothetical protein